MSNGAAYETSLKELLSALFKDAPQGSKLLLDVVDAKVNSGVLEKLEDAVASGLKDYLALGLQKVQDEGGEYVKFAGDLVDDPEAAVTYLLAKADAAIEGGAGEPLMDTVAAIAKGYAVEALATQQAKLESVKLTAED